MGIVLSSFPGCGKEYFRNTYGSKVKTIDLTEEYGEDSDYGDFANRVLSVVDQYDIVFVGATASVINALNERGVDYDVFYPSTGRRKEFLENWVRKHEKPDTIRKHDQSFDKMVSFIDDIEAPTCYKHKLEGFGEFIGNSPIIMQYVTSIQEKGKQTKNSKTDE